MHSSNHCEKVALPRRTFGSKETDDDDDDSDWSTSTPHSNWPIVATSCSIDDADAIVVVVAAIAVAADVDSSVLFVATTDEDDGHWKTFSNLFCLVQL